MRIEKHRSSLLAVGLLLAMWAPVQAASADGDWRYGLRIYGWLPNVSGSLNLPAPGGGGDIEADADEILDSLKMTFMASFEARKGDWAGFTDVIYLDLGGSESKSVSVPAGATVELLDADLDLKGWIWTLGGAYSIWQDKGSHLDLLAGARLFSLDVEMALSGGGPGLLERKVSKSVNLWDGIVGVKGNVVLDERWYLPYYADIGTGDTELTWVLAGGVGYRFDWGNLVLQYRHMHYDQGDEGVMQGIGFGGPLVGVEFHF